MFDRSRRVLKSLRNRVARVLGKQKEKPKTRPQIVIVRGSTLKRKWSLADLREEAPEASSVIDHGSTLPIRPPRIEDAEEEHATDDRSLSSASERNAGSIPAEVDKAEGGQDQYPAVGDLSDEEIEQIQLQAGVAFASRSRVRERPRGLVIDSAVLAGSDEIDTAVSPTNTNVPFRTSLPQTPWSFGGGTDGFGASSSLGILRSMPDASLARRCTVKASSCVNLQDRFDSYVDAIEQDDAKSCILHTVLSKDIFRLVAEVDVLDNRIAMADMRAAYRRISTLGPDTRPKTWHLGTAPISQTCHCGQGTEPEPEQQRNVPKRHTWHFGESRTARSRSRESEIKKDVIERHSAGTNLFCVSLYNDLKERRGLPDSQPMEEAAALRVEVSKTFNFRRECERVARRIQPTFAILRS